MPSELQEKVEEYLEFRQGPYRLRDHPEAEFAFEATHGDFNIIILSPEGQDELQTQVPFSLDVQGRQELESRLSRPEDRQEFFRELQRQLIDWNQSFQLDLDNQELQGWVVIRKRVVPEDFPDWQDLEDDFQNTINTHIRALTYVQEFVDDVDQSSESSGPDSDYIH